MPAKKISQRVAEKGAFSHIYNRGIEKRVIFADEEDYEVFLGYLKDYLTTPDPERAKKTFTVNGRIFKGIPHQPKNYFNKVELIAFVLMPNHFHLLLHQITEGALEKFIRSLCTRYSMYFNKKYKRTGALFEGPYKSVQIKDVSSLLFLTRYFHQTGDSSSYKEYLGLRKTSWVRPEVVLSSLKGPGGYRDFVEKYELTEKEKEALEGIVLESNLEHLERRVPELAQSQVAEEVPLAPAATAVKAPSRIPEFIGTAGIFLLLVTLGVRNINVSKANSAIPSPIPVVSGLGVEVEEVGVIVEEVKPKIILVVKITDGSTSVNIRQEPRVQSEKIGEAKNGETFEEFAAVNLEWYEIKLADGSTGFISARYVEKVEQRENQGDRTIVPEDGNEIADISFAVNEVKSADISSNTFDDTLPTLNIGGTPVTWNIGQSTGTDTINNDVDFTLLETENLGLASTVSSTTVIEADETLASLENLTITSSVTTDIAVKVDDFRPIHNFIKTIDQRILSLQKVDDTLVAASTFEAFLALENDDANKALAEATFSTAHDVNIPDFTRETNLDAANFTIEIVLENAEAIHNQTVGDYGTLTTSTATFNGALAVNGATSTALVLDTTVTSLRANGVAELVSAIPTWIAETTAEVVGVILTYDISALASTTANIHFTETPQTMTWNPKTSSTAFDGMTFELTEKTNN